jgi:hypothetical protein
MTNSNKALSASPVGWLPADMLVTLLDYFSAEDLAKARELCHPLDDFIRGNRMQNTWARHVFAQSGGVVPKRTRAIEAWYALRVPRPPMPKPESFGSLRPMALRSYVRKRTKLKAREVRRIAPEVLEKTYQHFEVWDVGTKEGKLRCKSACASLRKQRRADIPEPPVDKKLRAEARQALVEEGRVALGTARKLAEIDGVGRFAAYRQVVRGIQALTAVLTYAPPKEDPGWYHALMSLGVLCQRLSRYRDAIVYFQEARNRVPRRRSLDATVLALEQFTPAHVDGGTDMRRRLEASEKRFKAELLIASTYIFAAQEALKSGDPILARGLYAFARKTAKGTERAYAIEGPQLRVLCNTEGTARFANALDGLLQQSRNLRSAAKSALATL